MKKSKQIYGQPTSEDLAAMKMDLEYLTGIDLTQHMDESYPAQGSHEEEKELQRVIDASNDPRLSPEYHEIADRLIQAPFQAQAESLKITYPGDLIDKILIESQHYILILKYHYNRPRPTQVAVRLGKTLNKQLTPSAHTPSFPSGHAAQANLIATVMSRMYPRFKGQFNLVADSIERSRLEAGLHFPSDIVAGRSLGKHLGIISPLKRQAGLLESSEIDPVDVDKKIKVGLSLTIPEDLTVTDTLDAIKALRGITTVRQVGAQREQHSLGRSVVNTFVTVVGGDMTPEDLHRKVLSLDDIITVHIRNVDGKKYARLSRRGSKKVTTAESLLRECILIIEELTKSDKKEIERISKKTAKKEIDSAIKSFVKGDLEKEITKVLGNKATKEEVAKVSKNVIKRLYRELSVNYPAIIDRIKV